MNTLAQIFIAILGGTSVWLVSRKEEWKKYGYVLGLLSQPFWIYVRIANAQWGILFISCLYTYSWATGVYNYFIRTEADTILHRSF